MRGPSLRAALASTLLCAACAYRTPEVHVPASLPGFEVSEVTVSDERDAVDGDVEAELRSRTTQTLARAARPGAAKASVRVALVDHESNVYAPAMARDGCAAFGMIGVPAGQIIDRDTIVVDVSIVEPDGRIHRGWAIAEKMGSLYAPAPRRALAAALDRALANAAND